MIVTHIEREREREAETQAEGEAGSMHREPNVGLNPGSPGLRPGPKAGAKPLHHPEIPPLTFFYLHFLQKAKKLWVKRMYHHAPSSRPCLGCPNLEFLPSIPRNIISLFLASLQRVACAAFSFSKLS